MDVLLWKTRRPAVLAFDRDSRLRGIPAWPIDEHPRSLRTPSVVIISRVSWLDAGETWGRPRGSALKLHWRVNIARIRMQNTTLRALAEG